MLFIIKRLKDRDVLMFLYSYRSDVSVDMHIHTRVSKCVHAQLNERWTDFVVVTVIVIVLVLSSLPIGAF